MPTQRKMNRSEREDISHVWNVQNSQIYENKSRLAAASEWNELWAVGVIAERYRISLGSQENILKLIM